MRLGTRARPLATARSVRPEQQLVQDRGPAGEELLAEALSQVARAFQAESDTDAMLVELVETALRLVPGAQAASVGVLLRRKEVTRRHPTSSLIEQVDACEAQAGEGPCLDALSQQRTVRVPDLRHEQRWPTFVRDARHLDVGSMLSLRLWVEGDTLGALNLVSRQVDAFDDESERIGLLLASHAAVALAGARKLDHLVLAVASRDVIGQAKGMLMQRYDIDEERAFGVLLRVSQATQRKLHDVAHDLVHTGRLTADELPR